MLVGPPLDNWSTEDVTAIVCKFGRLLAWENDEYNVGRILAKVRCTKLQEIPKSVRLTDGENAESESWTFSIEVLQQVMLGVGPPDEDPLPDEGVDPHPLPLANFVPLVIVQAPAQINNANAANWENAMQQDNMQVENHNDLNDQNLDNQSSLTLTVSLSAGENSTNLVPNQQLINDEVDQLEHVNFFEPEEMVPVVVQGDQPALNINNFQNLGLGVQNIMLAYHGLSDDDEEAPLEDAA
jgi:hypothetical protein